MIIIGLSAVSKKYELFSSVVKLRNNISELLTKRKMYRSLRRTKLWYRKPRFSNRKIEKGWLAPSVQHRLDSHIRIIQKICSLLPIFKIRVEVANFDIQKINNPEISGKEYQHGDLYNYENLKSYLISRENSKCQLCDKESSKGNSFRIHHIIQRSKGGTNRSDNLALLHEKCHERLHEKNLNYLIKKNKQYKSETFMSIIRNRIVKVLKEKYGIVETTFGYITKLGRYNLRLEKSHSNDAFVISGGTNQLKCTSFDIIQKRHNNRCLQINRKGFKPSIRRSRSKYQPKDIVIIENKKYEVVASFNKGTYVTVKNRLGNYNFKVSKIDKHYFVSGWKFEFVK